LYDVLEFTQKYYTVGLYMYILRATSCVLVLL
jgi:hypothetical protein